MINTLGIRIGGYGGEYTIGTLTPEQANYWREKDDDELFRHITDRKEFDSDSEHYIGLWHDVDNIIHIFGCNSIYNITITINDEVVSRINNDDLSQIETLQIESIDEDDLKSETPYLICKTTEKGTFLYCNIELDEDEIFDISKVTLLTKEIFGDKYIVGARYDDLDMVDYGGDTDGKSFDYRIEYFEKN